MYASSNFLLSHSSSQWSFSSFWEVLPSKLRNISVTKITNKKWTTPFQHFNFGVSHHSYQYISLGINFNVFPFMSSKNTKYRISVCLVDCKTCVLILNMNCHENKCLTSFCSNLFHFNNLCNIYMYYVKITHHNFIILIFSGFQW